jgi:hypothetical protein
MASRLIDERVFVIGAGEVEVFVSVDVEPIVGVDVAAPQVERVATDDGKANGLIGIVLGS